MLKELRSRMEKGLEILFPPKCIFCGCVLETGRKLHICRSCYNKIPFASGDVIRSGRQQDGGCDCAVCIFRYTGIVKDALIRFKFFDKPGYYRTFARMLSGKLSETMGLKSFDFIVSVPLHKERQRSRGYNQAQLIAGELSRETGIPEYQYLLLREKNTKVQSLLPGREREQNVRGAFKINNGSRVKGKTVLLVDDVLTTGSTVDECSRALKEAGAISVVAAVLATGKKY